jgi:hypothetical protein
VLTLERWTLFRYQVPRSGQGVAVCSPDERSEIREQRASLNAGPGFRRRSIRATGAIGGPPLR